MGLADDRLGPDLRHRVGANNMVDSYQNVVQESIFRWTPTYCSTVGRGPQRTPVGTPKMCLVGDGALQGAEIVHH